MSFYCGLYSRVREDGFGFSGSNLVFEKVGLFSIAGSNLALAKMASVFSGSNLTFTKTGLVSRALISRLRRWVWFLYSR